MSKEDIMNEAFDAGLVTLGAVGVGFFSKRILKDGLGVPSTPMTIAKTRGRHRRRFHTRPILAK